MFDPTFVVQKVQHLAQITGPLTDGFYTADFRGREYQVKSVAGNPLQVGDLCSLIDFGPLKYVVKSDAGYPTRWIRNLADWSEFPAALFMKYIMRENPKSADFKIGTTVETVSASILRVACWDGITRDLTVEYAGTVKSASSFSAGDPVVCYWKTGSEWVVIGRSATITVSPDPITGLGTNAVTITQEGGTEGITISAPSPISASTASLPVAGGVVNMWIPSVANYTRCAAGKVSVSSGGQTVQVDAALITAGFPSTFGNYPVGQSSYIHNMQIVITGVTATLSVILTGDFEVAPSLSGPWSNSSTVAESGYLFFRFTPTAVGPRTGTAAIDFDGVAYNPALAGQCRSVSGTFRYYYHGIGYVEQSFSCTSEAGDEFTSGFLVWDVTGTVGTDCFFEGTGYGYTVKIELIKQYYDGSGTEVVASDSDSLDPAGESVSLSCGPVFLTSGWRIFAKITATPD